MYSQSEFTIGAILFCTLLSVGTSLKCYECTSALDENCGSTWGYDIGGGKSEDFLHTCEGAGPFACRKLQYTDPHFGTLVTRGCWNNSGVEEALPDLDCQEMHMGMVCYCAGDNRCNGQQSLHAHALGVIVTGFISLVYHLF